MSKIPSYNKANTLLTLAEKVAQCFMPAAFINDSEEEIQKLENLIRNHRLGGICFFHSRASAATNYEGKKEVIHNEESLTTLKKLIFRYQQAAEHPLLISIDAEWGLAMRIENTPQYPYAITLGAIEGYEELLFQIGKNMARDCNNAGIHWNFAPVADVNNNPQNPVIGYRSFGSDKHKVAQNVIALAKGLQSEGILNSVKHFPGHGDTATDSHLGLPVIDKTLEALLQNELYPFQKAIENGIDSVMVGHLAVPSLCQGQLIPSSISKDIIQGLLRNTLDFDGVVVTDALNMHAVSKLFSEKGALEWAAFDAGNDILCFAENVVEGIQHILDKGSPERIEASFKRIWKLKEKVFNLKPVRETAALPSAEELNKEAARVSLTICAGNEDYIGQFRSMGFAAVEMARKPSEAFFEVLKGQMSFQAYSSSDLGLDAIKIALQTEQCILLALYPPQVKPKDNFGFSKEEIDFIQELIVQKEVVIYLFGNPYVLHAIDLEKAKAVVLVYQDFNIFQQQAAQHFLGDFKAKGVLPFTIKQTEI